MKGERLSLIVLVGRGWAYDDAVVDYSVMSDSNHFSPLNPSERGVEMWSDCRDEGGVAADERGFRPRYRLGCGTGRGAPALHTDHRPMGVRLRVLDR
jgi:hypothetical protein